jgi:hypothetical protein
MSALTDFRFFYAAFFLSAVRIIIFNRIALLIFVLQHPDVVMQCKKNIRRGMGLYEFLDGPCPGRSIGV